MYIIIIKAYTHKCVYCDQEQNNRIVQDEHVKKLIIQRCVNK